MEHLPGLVPVLVVSGDAALLDRVLAVTAAVGVQPEVVVEEAALRLRWTSAALVLVGLDQASQVAALVLPRHPELYLLSGDEGLAEACSWSARLGAAVLSLPQSADELAAVVAGAGDHRTGGRVVCLVGGSGGAGASTCSAGLAVEAARAGGDVVLVDADERGGGLDLLLGAEEAPGWRWPRLTGARGFVGDLRGQLPRAFGVDLLSMAREAVPAPALVPDQVRALLQALVRTHELVVVDLPRRSGPAEWEALRQADQVLLVVRADLRGVAAAREVARELRTTCPSLATVVRRVRSSGLTAEDVADAVELPLASTVAYEADLVLAAERGEPPGRTSRSPLARSSRQLLGSLAGVERAA